MSNIKGLDLKKWSFSMRIDSEIPRHSKKSLKKPLFYLAGPICKCFAPLLLSGYSRTAKENKGFFILIFGVPYISSLLEMFPLAQLRVVLSINVNTHTHTYWILMHMWFSLVATVLKSPAILKVGLKLIFRMSFTFEGIDYIYCMCILYVWWVVTGMFS